MTFRDIRAMGRHYSLVAMVYTYRENLSMRHPHDVDLICFEPRTSRNITQAVYKYLSLGWITPVPFVPSYTTRFPPVDTTPDTYFLRPSIVPPELTFSQLASCMYLWDPLDCRAPKHTRTKLLYQNLTQSEQPIQDDEERSELAHLYGPRSSFLQVSRQRANDGVTEATVSVSIPLVPMYELENNLEATMLTNCYQPRK